MDADKILLDFFKYYPSDHWFYKATILKNILENHEDMKDTLILNMQGIIEEDYIKMMKTEIHFAYFQMVEALFELIFALEKYPAKEVWLRLSVSRGHELRDRIPKFIQENSEFLNNLVKRKNGSEIPLIHHLFFYGFNFPTKVKKSTGDLFEVTQEILEKSYQFIRDCITQFAKDYEDRYDYNSYKHALRYLHRPTHIEIGKISENEELSPLLNLTAEDSIVFLCQKKEVVNLVIKGFDWKQDYKKIVLCHELIMNIINTRRRFFYKQLGPVAMFHDRDIKEIYEQENTLETISTPLFIKNQKEE